MARMSLFSVNFHYPSQVMIDSLMVSEIFLGILHSSLHISLGHWKSNVSLFSDLYLFWKLQACALQLQSSARFRKWRLESLRAAAECRDTEACPFQILTRFTQPHYLCSRLSTEISQNLDSNNAATLGPSTQFNCTTLMAFN